MSIISKYMKKSRIIFFVIFLIAIALVLVSIYPQMKSGSEKNANNSACLKAPTYKVYDKTIKILKVQNCSGSLMSTASPPPGQGLTSHPFVNAQALSARYEGNLKELLNKSNNFDEFISLLKEKGYNITIEN